jgi:hypothetical protein
MTRRHRWPRLPIAPTSSARPRLPIGRTIVSLLAIAAALAIVALVVRQGRHWQQSTTPAIGGSFPHDDARHPAVPERFSRGPADDVDPELETVYTPVWRIAPPVADPLSETPLAVFPIPDPISSPPSRHNPGGVDGPRPPRLSSDLAH